MDFRRSGCPLAFGGPSHSVPDPAHVEDVVRSARVVADLAAERFNQAAHQFVVGVAIFSPDPGGSGRQRSTPGRRSRRAHAVTTGKSRSNCREKFECSETDRIHPGACRRLCSFTAVTTRMYAMNNGLCAVYPLQFTRKTSSDHNVRCRQGASISGSGHGEAVTFSIPSIQVWNSELAGTQSSVPSRFRV